MHKNKKFFSIVLIIIIVAIAIGGYYTTRANNTLTIGIYTGSSWDVPNGKQYHMIEKAIKTFKKDHPDIKVQYESGIRKSDYLNWLSEKIVSGQTPDVMIVPAENFNVLASEDTFKNLNPYLEQDHLKESFYRGALAAGNYHGKQYMLPYETNPTLMVANNKILNDEHVKLSDIQNVKKFQQICRKISRHGKYNAVTSSYDWQDSLLAYDSRPFNSNGEVDLTSAKARQGFSLIEDLSSENHTHNVTRNMFDQGKVAFMPLSLAEYRTYTSYPYHVTRNLNSSWKVSRMPGKNSTPSSTVGFAISRQSTKFLLAWQFIKLMCANPQIQQELMKTNMGCSVMPSVINSPQTQKILENDSSSSASLTTKELNTILNNEAILPKFKNYDQIMERLDYQINQAIKDGDLDSSLFNIQIDLNHQLK